MEKSISAQLVMQNFMLERFLERVSVSKYQDAFILKGGFLIASMVGLDSRATMDMDATIKGIPVTEDTVKEMRVKLEPVDRVEKGTYFSMKTNELIRRNDKLFKIVPTEHGTKKVE